MLRSDVRLLVYPFDNPLGGYYMMLPGETVQQVLNQDKDEDLRLFLMQKLYVSCRKICLMWKAGDEAIVAEQSFYNTTIHESPALFGEDAINVHYHLEAMILFARSCLDVASVLFSTLLFQFPSSSKKDSFNDFLKQFIKIFPDHHLTEAFLNLREDKTSWLSALCGTEKGRSIRDKIAHQTEFPIEYVELNERSQKESPVVIVGDTYIPLSIFIDELRHNLISHYIDIENFIIECRQTTSNRNSI